MKESNTYYDMDYTTISYKTADQIVAEWKSFYSEEYEKALISYNPLKDLSSKQYKPKKSINSKLKKIIAEESLKDQYSVSELLTLVDELYEKEIGDFCITGSLALYLQGKIKRDKFHDVDILISGDYVLDDDVEDINGKDYSDQKVDLGYKRKACALSGVRMCIFENSNKDSMDFVDVIINNKTYKCQHYSYILNIKLAQALKYFKDKDDLIGSSIKIEIV